MNHYFEPHMHVLYESVVLPVMRTEGPIGVRFENGVVTNPQIAKWQTYRGSLAILSMYTFRIMCLSNTERKYCHWRITLDFHTHSEGTTWIPMVCYVNRPSIWMRQLPKIWCGGPLQIPSKEMH